MGNKKKEIYKAGYYFKMLYLAFDAIACAAHLYCSLLLVTIMCGVKMLHNLFIDQGIIHKWILKRHSYLKFKIYTFSIHMMTNYLVLLFSYL